MGETKTMIVNGLVGLHGAFKNILIENKFEADKDEIAILTRWFESNDSQNIHKLASQLPFALQVPAGRNELLSILASPIPSCNDGVSIIKAQYIDTKTGKIQIVDEKDRDPLLRIINSVSIDRYVTDNYGYVMRDGNRKNIVLFRSKEFSDRINEGIQTNKNLFIAINEDIPAFDYNDNTIKYFVIDNGGGGGTSFLKDVDYIFCYITGKNSPNPIKMKDGTDQYYTPTDIFLHEIIGHAIPRMIGKNGNAIANENIVRRQMQWKERAVDKSHVCFE